jgi:peptidyl-dipeptidase Dcp
MELMMSVWEPKGASTKRCCSHAKNSDSEGREFKIRLWDYRYYSEKVRKEKYDLTECSEGISLKRGINALLVNCLICNRRLLMPVYHADVRVWEVSIKRQVN